MTSTVFPCYAAEDSAAAAEVARFLEDGADVRVFLEEGQLRPGETLASMAREGRTADIVLVLFCRVGRGRAAMSHVSCAPSSNRTCGFPASGSPIIFFRRLAPQSFQVAHLSYHLI